MCHCRYTCGYLLFIQVWRDPKQKQCSTVQGRMQSPLCSGALQRKVTAGLCQCNYSYGDLMFVHWYSDPAPTHCSSVQSRMQSTLFRPALVWSDPQEMQCSTVQGRMQSTLFSVALQKKPTAGLCHCKYTCGYLLFIQVWRDPKKKAMQHCSGQNAVTALQWCSAKKAHSRLVSMQLQLWRSDVCTLVQ